MITSKMLLNGYKMAKKFIIREIYCKLFTVTVWCVIDVLLWQIMSFFSHLLNQRLFVRIF